VPAIVPAKNKEIDAMTSRRQDARPVLREVVNEWDLRCYVVDGRFEFSGSPTGIHSLDVGQTSETRLQEHWRGYQNVVAGQPRPAQLVALREYAEQFGTDWKERLAADWLNAGTGTSFKGDFAYLQQLRNGYGPSWLSGYSLPPHAGRPLNAPPGYEREEHTGP
jgi:hypothetical protein